MGTSLPAFVKSKVKMSDYLGVWVEQNLISLIIYTPEPVDVQALKN